MSLPQDLLLVISARAIRDSEYRRRLINDPSGVLAEAAPGLKGGVVLRVLEDTADVAHMILPIADLAAEYKHHAQLALQRMWDLADGAQLRVVRNTAGIQYLLLPACGEPVQGDGRLSDGDLEHVAGGTDDTFYPTDGNGNYATPVSSLVLGSSDSTSTLSSS